MIPHDIVQSVKRYHELLSQEREIRKEKEQIAEKLIRYFQARREKDPSFGEFEVNGLKCLYIVPVVDSFNIPGLFKALSKKLTPSELEELFPRFLDDDYLEELIQKDRISRRLVAKYWIPIEKKPYIRVLPDE